MKRYDVRGLLHYTMTGIDHFYVAAEVDALLREIHVSARNAMAADSPMARRDALQKVLDLIEQQSR